MTDLSTFDPNNAGNPNNNIFGLPFSEEESRLVILPVPWEVSVSYGVGTARNTDHIFKASLQIDLFDPDAPDAWRKGFFMRPYDQKVLLKFYDDFFSRRGVSCRMGKATHSKFTTKTRGKRA